MNQNDFRSPLIQSGIVLVVLFVAVAIVASSPAEGFFGSIFALISGLFKGLLFIVALSIGLVFSIAVLIGIFLAAVSIYSVENAKTLFDQLKSSLVTIYCRMRSCEESPVDTAPGATKLSEPQPDTDSQSSISETEPSVSAAPVEADDQFQPAPAETVEGLEAQLAVIEDSLGAVEKQVGLLQTHFEEQQTASSELTGRFDGLESASTKLSETLQECEKETAATAASLTSLEQSLKPAIEALTSEIAELKKKTSVPEVVSGILSYIDSQDDRDALTERAKEAVSRGMTYAQTDEFFKEVLPTKVHRALTEHPRLTKDFIRSIKKKFE